jgi:hypothetical protein
MNEPRKTPGTSPTSKSSSEPGGVRNIISVSADGPVKVRLLTGIGSNACVDMAWVNHQATATVAPATSPASHCRVATLLRITNQTAAANQITPKATPATWPPPAAASRLSPFSGATVHNPASQLRTGDRKPCRLA